MKTPFTTNKSLAKLFIRCFRCGDFSFQFDQFLNARKSWELPGADRPDLKIQGSDTSLSDRTPYLKVCELAVENDEIFSQFKSCSHYRAILEHVSRDLGQQYLEIVRTNPRNFDQLKELFKYELGSPFTFFYKGLGRCSPTQIRYS